MTTNFPGAWSVLVGDLSGNVGDDRSVAGQITCPVSQTGQRGEVDADVHGPASLLPPVSRVEAVTEQVEEHVGPELVDGAGFAVATQLLGETVDPIGGLGSPIRWQVEPGHECGAVRVGSQFNMAILHGCVVTGGRVVRVDVDT